MVTFETSRIDSVYVPLSRKTYGLPSCDAVLSAVWMLLHGVIREPHALAAPVGEAKTPLLSSATKPLHASVPGAVSGCDVSGSDVSISAASAIAVSPVASALAPSPETSAPTSPPPSVPGLASWPVTSPFAPESSPGWSATVKSPSSVEHPVARLSDTATAGGASARAALDTGDFSMRRVYI